MNLYLLKVAENKNFYDSYDACIVAADNPQEAILITPTTIDGNTGKWDIKSSYQRSSWTIDIDKVSWELIGTALPGTSKGVILSSFQAG